MPSRYAFLAPMPLWVCLHGASQSSTLWNDYCGLAENRGFIVLAPDSRGVTWDLRLDGFGPDVEFLNRALTHTFARCRIDPARMARAGFSDGASYSLALGLANGDLFTHLVAYSPGFLFYAPQLVGLPRIFISHGTQDTVLPVLNTRDGIVPGLRRGGYDVTYREFVGPHAVPADISLAALDWFFAAP